VKITEAHPAVFQSDILELLSFAASKASEEYRKYFNLAQRKLFICEADHAIIGCIGIEFKTADQAEIKHIAVAPERRGQQIGGKLIEFVCEKYRLSAVFAETDQDAVDFYKKSGFEIMSLGEKYPGRERFWCHKSLS